MWIVASSVLWGQSERHNRGTITVTSPARLPSVFVCLNKCKIKACSVKKQEFIHFQWLAVTNINSDKFNLMQMQKDLIEKLLHIWYGFEHVQDRYWSACILAFAARAASVCVCVCFVWAGVHVYDVSPGVLHGSVCSRHSLKVTDVMTAGSNHCSRATGRTSSVHIPPVSVSLTPQLSSAYTHTHTHTHSWRVVFKCRSQKFILKTESHWFAI